MSKNEYEVKNCGIWMSPNSFIIQEAWVHDFVHWLGLDIQKKDQPQSISVTSSSCPVKKYKLLGLVKKIIAPFW